MKDGFTATYTTVVHGMLGQVARLRPTLWILPAAGIRRAGIEHPTRGRTRGSTHVYAGA